MARFRVLLTDYAWPDLDLERSIFSENDIELIVAQSQDERTLAAAATDADAIMTNWAPVPAAVLRAATKCRMVARLGIGLDNIDVATASALRMVVTNVPDYCLIEVAEHALALLLALARKAAWYHLETKRGVYDIGSGPMLRRIEGQTLGIVGLGQIGRRLADKATALGLNVVATMRDARSAPAQGVTLYSLDRLLGDSDYVSLHVPLVPETRKLIGAEQLALMKPTAYLINTARGGLVDHEALASALAAGRLAGAGLDVQDPEPPDLKRPPWNDPRVIVTPHAAFLSAESLAELRMRAARQVVDFLQGRRPEAVVNPAVLA